jgi:hypothetical protein
VGGYILGREIIFGKDELTLKLTGLVGFFALKQKIKIPYRLIKSVYVDYFNAPQWMIRMPGTSLSPLNIYEGSFKYRDEWYFLSYEHRVPLVIIELEGHKKYKYVIVEMNDPTDTAAEIRRRIRKLN